MIAYLLTFLVFIFNIWLINQGSGFTVPREMLFRNLAPIHIPIIFFPLILAVFLIISKLYLKYEYFLSKRIIHIAIFAICILFSLSLFHTVQTNPDYGHYQREAKYFVENGPLVFLKNWGTFSCYFNMPLISFLRGVFFQIFGEGQFAVLLLNLIFTIGIFFFTLKIAEKLFNNDVAWISILLLSSIPFFLTQTPLFLVDIGLTFFVSASFYLNLSLIHKPTYSKSLLTSIILFFTLISKVFGLVYLIFIFAGFLTYLMVQKKDKEIWIRFLSSWFLTFLLSLTYVIWKWSLFNKMIINFTWSVTLLKLFLPIFLIFLIGFFSFYNRHNIEKLFRKVYPKLHIIIYLLLLFLFFYSNKPLFYLRSTIVATSIPLALLFYSSIFVTFKNKSMSGFLLLLWFFSIMAIPNTMFKYQLPTYPAIAILVSYSLVSIFKSKKIRSIALSVILSFSITITYFFFLPMIQTHVKNNIRNATKIYKLDDSDRLAIVPYPVGEYGDMFIRSLENPTSCPHPPSLVDIVDYYSNAKVYYETRSQLVSRLILRDNLPDAIYLVHHLDLPIKEDSELDMLLKDKYDKGPIFDEAKGSGIWRVKIATFFIK